MSKKKRTFKSEVVTPTTLQLNPLAKPLEKNLDQTYHDVAKKQYFPPELIARLTERIKKL